MTDTMRWRYGDTNPVVSKPVATGVTIEIGDLVAQDASGNVTPASTQTWTTDLPTTQGAFHTSFLGVAMQRSAGSDNGTIRVATTGVFEMECAAATFNLGDLVAPGKATGNALLSQQVVAVGAGNESKAIGRVAGYVNPAGTSVLVAMCSTIMLGGPQTPM
ncbi:MAG TPA: hypothetical protein VMF30_18010 [Pirellulales bacterium]|nr:hypothetical protein [Pirellulales bacterium]